MNAGSTDCLALQWISDRHRFGKVPRHSELDLIGQIVLENQITKCSELHRSVSVAWMQDSVAIRRFSRLTQHQKELENAGLACAVAPKKHSYWGKPDVAGISPSFEVFD